MVKWWRHSKLRFYILNTLWNYSFWLHAKPVYKYYHYTIEGEIDLEKSLSSINMKSQTKKIHKKKRRFQGLYYKGTLFQDNPGIQGENKETWDAWIKKGLIKD